MEIIYIHKKERYTFEELRSDTHKNCAPSIKYGELQNVFKSSVDSKLTVKEIREIAKKKGIDVPSSLNKTELVYYLDALKDEKSRGLVTIPVFGFRDYSELVPKGINDFDERIGGKKIYSRKDGLSYL
jgi:hypothetical protein